MRLSVSLFPSLSLSHSFPVSVSPCLSVYLSICLSLSLSLSCRHTSPVGGSLVGAGMVSFPPVWVWSTLEPCVASNGRALRHARAQSVRTASRASVHASSRVSSKPLTGSVSYTRTGIGGHDVMDQGARTMLQDRSVLTATYGQFGPL